MPSPRLAIRVISLSDATERRALVAANLADCPLPWEFLDGSRPGDPSPVISDPAAQTATFGRALTAGEIGCFNSHRRALALFETDPELDWLLVMEDDVWLDPAFPYGELAGWLEAKSIGFLRLFVREWRRAYPRYRFGERQVLYLATDPYGSQGYLISRAAAARFRARLSRQLRPIDDELGRFWENGLDNHVLFPFPMVERHFGSTLNDARNEATLRKPPASAHRRWVKARDYLVKRGYLAWRRSPFARDRIRPRKR